MSRCLDDRELVMFHAGDGSNIDREHLETCLACARKYRDLQGDMHTLLTALRRAPEARAVGRAGEELWPRTLRWALAASVVVAAFAGGRITGLTTPEPPMRMVTASSNVSARQIAMADDASTGTPAGYGLYIDDLIGPNATDQDQQAAEQGDPDNQIDPDSGAF